MIWQNRLNICLATFLVATLGCTRDMQENQSKIVFRTPPSPNVNAKALNTQSLPTGETFCYALAVSGGGLDSEFLQCHPDAPIFSGFIEPSSQVAMTVPKGQNRKVELFGYRAKVGETCLSVNQKNGRGLSKVDTGHLYAMGKQEGIDMTGDEVVVIIQMSFPGLTSHIGVTQPFPSSCFDGSSGPAPAEPAGGRLAGAYYTVYGGISSGAGDSESSGTYYSVIRGGIKNVTR
ncbi:MAG: hypothetical protein HRT45_08350 [Bdellovibrionales bacterium]|nr:hypothetical protein [Bdellovibrionales bacterium]